MTTIGITGATGALGTLVIADLLERGISAEDLVAIVRNPAKAKALGVPVRAADYDDPADWPEALEGVDTLLLVSASEPGKRVLQHAAVIDGAVKAGVTRIAYTSLLRAATSENPLAPEHKATEELLAASGLAVTILRNGWYVENYTGQLGHYLATGAIVDATEGATISAATRADYAAATATVLTTTGHEGKIYELGGTGFTLADLAKTITEVTGTTVVEKAVTVEELTDILVNAAGLPAPTAAFVASLDAGAARGDLTTDSTDLADLMRRPGTPLAEAVAAANTAGV